MFKRKLFQRALPIILSVAMTFQSVPMTALAAETQAVEETVQDESTVAAEATETESVEVAVEEETSETESVEVAAEEGTSSPQEERTAKIVVDDEAVDAYAKKQYEDNGVFGYTRILGEEGLAFFTTYVEGNGNYTAFRTELQKWFSVEVDGERLDTLKDRITYSWAKKGEGEGAADTPLTDDIPKDAGEYVLTISMPDTLTDIYEKFEGSITLSLTIEKADIELALDDNNSKSAQTDPGKTAQELIDEINENYTIQYKDGKYKVSRDILDIRNEAGTADPDKKLPLSIFVLGETGERQLMRETDRFDRTKDYVLTIGDIPLTDNAARNYVLSVADSYVITVGKRLETAVLFERKDSGEDLREVYDPAISWTIDNVTANLFVDEAGAPAVYIKGEDDEYSVRLDSVLPEGKSAEPMAAWYTRSAVDNLYVADTDAGEIAYVDKDLKNYVYTPMAQGAAPTDAGEYYIIWTYDGDDGAYEASHSEAIRFTIDPVPVVIRMSQGSVDNAGFSEGMVDEDVRKALAKISYDVYPLVKSETTGEWEQSGTPLTRTPDFFGTSYMGDVGIWATQYFAPEFVLQRRVVEMKQKDDAAAIPVDPREVDWRTITDEMLNKWTLKAVVDDDEELREIWAAEELPQDITLQYIKNLESVTFEFRVYFTGNKVVYDTDGNKVIVNVPITDVTTHAANRNYLADITRTTLEETAVPVTVKEAEDVQIVTDAIVDAFIDYNRDMLVPQPSDGTDARDIHQGTLENPAAKIYDRNALFKDRASYKKAVVYKSGQDGGVGDALSISSTDRSLQYTWSYITLDAYEDYLATWDEVQRQYKDLEGYADLFWGWTDITDGTLDFSRSAGLYRLTVTYDDPDHVYRSAEAEVFFVVERQEIVIVPTEKYAQIGQNILGWSNNIDKVIGEDFTIYRLPHNSMEEYAALTDEGKQDYKVPTKEAVDAFEADNGRKPDMNLKNLDDTEWELEWKVLRKEKDPATGLDKDPAVWVEAYQNPGTVFGDDFTYGVVAHWTGNLFELEGENLWQNYTTKDIATYRETGEEKHHESVGDIVFYTHKLYVEVDVAQIKALGKEYDGEPVSLEQAAKALTFYTDAELTESSKLNTEDIVNITDEYDPTKVNIYWAKEVEIRETTEDGNVIKKKIDAYYANRNAVYGGTYELRLRFAGGVLGASGDTLSAQDNAGPDAGQKIYAPGIAGGDYINTGDDVDGTFTITPREITIAPNVLSADILAAGARANTILTNELTLDERILEKDKRFFTYAEIAVGGFDVIWDGIGADGADAEGSAYEYEIDKNGGYPAFYNSDTNSGAARYIIQVDGREIKDPAREYLRFGSTYTVKLTNELASPLKESYRVTYGTADVTITNRGNADVTSIFVNNVMSALSASGIVFEFDGGNYTVKPRGAVRFYDNGVNVNVIGRNGRETLTNTNILGFRIYAPEEFLNDFAANSEKFVYKNAVWNAGGYFFGDSDWREDRGVGNHYIDVVFPLTKDDTKRSFNITWEDGYTETFTLGDIVLEEDLTKAVVPKSIAFNGVSKKMAVGERQQLDLKITKAQLGDVISIRYRIKGGETKNEYISLDPETGVVTALKAGKKATVVEAYPVYRDAHGNIVPITDSKGKAKTALTKITVTEVTASAVKKVTAQDGTAKVYFTVPDNGYRREIYVVDITKGTEYEGRKKWKAKDFNKAIDSMANGQWENAGFAIAPVYSYVDNEDLYIKEINGTYDKKLKAHITEIENLEAEHEFIIYVRNVSAARALDDGSVVALSASGGVKKFKTTKPQVLGLELGFTVKTDEKDKKHTVTNIVNDDGSIDVNAYTVELSAKKAQLNVYGLFSDKAGGNDAADDGDLRRYSLVPTLKGEKKALKKYQLPKLEYVVLDRFVQQPFYPGLEKSEYATISKKGLISLKGVDLNGEQTVCIYVRDSVRHEDDFLTDAMIELTITAKPASMKGKKVKMTVGETIRLSDYLEYKDAKKKKIPDYRSGGVMITKEMIAAAEASGYRIDDFEGNPMVHDWYITAVSPNKAAFNLAVTDFDAKGNPMKATVRLTSTQISAVKGLRVTYVDDQNITVNFTHAANSNENDNGRVYDYALEVKDARGNVVDKIVLSRPNVVADIYGVNAKELKNAQSWIQFTNTGIVEINPDNRMLIVDSTSAPGAFNYYTGTKAKTKTFAYTYTSNKLVRLSSYTITVTPLFGNQKASKAVKVKTKTTNLPASYSNVDVTAAKPDLLGGEAITITSSGMQNDLTVGVTINNAPYRFISGNIYTLRLAPNAVARDRVTDTLTWKSSNTKVASVKANAGTYTATFKAVNQGRTTITVTSKVTKKVIARWAVTVYAVKDGSSYGGGYEPTWPNGFYERILALYDPFYEGRLEVLSMNVPLVIDNRDAEGGVETWVSFTAPHYGQYTFSRAADFFDSRDGKRLGGNTNTLFLEAGQKVYFRIRSNGTLILTVTGTELARLTKAHTESAPLEVTAGYVAFTAWEDNIYTFWHNGSKFTVDGKTATGMKAGETKYINVTKAGKMYVTWREVTQELTTGTASTGTVTLDKDNQVRYISFTANTDGEYKFTYQTIEGAAITFSAADGSSLNGKVVFDSSAATADEETVSVRYKLEEGDKVVIEVKADPEITDAAKALSVSVTVSIAQQRRKIENNMITIPKGTTEIVEYVIPSFTTEKARFEFEVTGETGTRIIEYLDTDYKTIGVIDGTYFALTVSKTSGIKTGDSIYIRVKAGGSADDADAKNAVLTVTQVPIDTLTVDSEKTKEVTNDTEQWYTFTAPEDGYYEFGVTVAKRAEGDNTPTHSVTLALCKELFGTSSEGTVTTNGTKILSLKTGEMLAIELRHSSANNTADVTSTAKISVNKLTVTPLGLDKASGTVSIPAKSTKALYYSFTATVDADYTIAWKPADAEKDNARVTYFNDITSQNGAQEVAVSGSSVRLKAGNVRYIKVAIKNSTGDNAVNGTLLVTTENLDVDALTAGTPYAFHLKDEDGSGDEKIVKFTAPESGNYAIVTTVGVNAADDNQPYAYPTLWTYEIQNGARILQKIGTPYTSMKFEKGETKYFMLTYGAGTSAVKETKGTITIRSLTEAVTGDQADVTVSDGVTKEYTFTIPASGRYEFKADYDEKKATVQWKNADDDTTLRDGNYYPKNTKVKVVVTGRDEEADASVKLYKPALITMKSLTVGANDISVSAGETKYYELNVNDPKTYEFELSEISSTIRPTIARVTNNNNNWSTLSNNTAISMSKDSRLIIRITSGSEDQDISCKLTVTERRELSLGANAVHLDAGESVNLLYRAYEAGYYSFSANPGSEFVQISGSGITKTGDSFYGVVELAAKDTRTYTLTNNGSSGVDFTVTMAKEETIELTPGSTAEAVSIPAGRKVYYALKTFKSADYIIKITDTGKGESLGIDLSGDGLNSVNSKKITDNIVLECSLGGETMLTITNNGSSERTVTVALDMSEVQLMTDEAITLTKNESRLISFVATEDSRYLISKNNEDVKMTLVSEQRVSTGETTKRSLVINDYREYLLNQGDKLIFKLSYEPAGSNENAEASQTVTIKVEKIVPTLIQAEATSVTIGEKDHNSVWYQFTAAKDAVHTFTLEDADGKAVSGRMMFYQYFMAANGDTNVERDMRAGRKVFINVNNLGAGSYTLKYTTAETMTETGVTTLDFEYKDEVQEVKFVVPKGGIYKISATAVRGSFNVAGSLGSKVVVGNFATNGSKESGLLMKDDIVTFKVTAMQDGKSSVTLRIAEYNTADTLTLGREYAGVSDTAKDIYYEIRITKKAKYTIKASGGANVTYCVNNGTTFMSVNSAVSKDFDKDDRIFIKVGKTASETEYTIKIAEISETSSDGNNP